MAAIMTWLFIGLITIFFLPWILAVTFPLWASLGLMLGGVVLLITETLREIKLIILGDENLGQAEINNILVKCAYNDHLFDGVDIHIDKKRDGHLELFARFVSHGVHWGFRLKGSDMHDLAMRLSTKLNKTVEHNLPYEKLIKFQNKINRNDLFLLHHSKESDIVWGNKAVLFR